jgi:L-alanine-DL-glutamate epimerase-like enolase superfamily enzyme
MRVKVSELIAYQVRIPLRKTIRHASHTRDSTENVVVRCVLQDGSEGFGEGVPREYVTGETIDEAINSLQESDLRAQLESCPDFAHAVAMAERLRLTPVPGDDRNCRRNAARCAVELASLDAYGRHFGETLGRVTKLLSPELYEFRPWVRYSGVILSASTWFKVRAAAWRARIYRFPDVKVKVGIPGQDDVFRLKNIRLRLGWKKDLRVDANEAWPRTEAAERIRALQPFRISAVEQPVPHADVDVLREVRQTVGVPIMLDESLCSLIDAERALQQHSCDLYNLRLSKCGGFIPTLRLAQFAVKHGLGYQLGCQVGETALLSAAGRQFATSVAGLRYLEGSYDRHLVRETLAKSDITFRWGGWAPALDGAGLGIDVDKAALERTAIRRAELKG